VPHRARVWRYYCTNAEASALNQLGQQELNATCAVLDKGVLSRRQVIRQKSKMRVTVKTQDVGGSIMMIGKFDKEGKCYRGRIFSRERCGRVITFRPMPVKQGDGPDFVVISVSETQDDDEFEISAAWKKTSSKGKPYVLVKLDGPTFWNGAHCALIKQQDGTFGLVWKRTKLKAEEAAEAAA
jgi:uncharacterized protein (DUF736 family)